jgi:hypothetical protein
VEPQADRSDLDRPAAPPRGRRRAALIVTLANCALMALLVSPGGPELVSVLSPEPGEVIGVDGVVVVARVPADGRVRSGSLRVLLNGADVTPELITADNGAVGRLHGVLDGENVLRVEVEASSWWQDGRAFATGREVRFLARRPLNLDRG